MQQPLIIAAQGDGSATNRIKRALAAVFPDGVPESVRVASVYSLIFSLRDDQHRSCIIRVDFDTLFDFFLDGRASKLGTFNCRNVKLLDRIALLTYEYLRALHLQKDGSVIYASAEVETVQ